MSKLAVNKPSNFEVELRDLVKPLGFADHRDAFAKIQTFVSVCNIHAREIPALLKSGTYPNPSRKDKLVDTVSLTKDFAIRFGLWVNPYKGQYLLDKLKEQQAQLVLAKDNEIAKLTSDLATAKAKVVYTNTKFNRISRHKELMDLVSSGILDVSTYQVTQRKYSVTAYGLQLGYSTNDNGTVLQP